ncbi:hypothetical protein NPIL_313231 [Nephila pilipes]|uniref:Uncharacterized protein n=1 Tax=Nephila pilipes TaxID=299642 RepID=A0A8X6TYB2_NEPPI|nr:hypothetical protein NPIL_313231 [Nephila pilipes]
MLPEPPLGCLPEMTPKSRGWSGGSDVGSYSSMRVLDQKTPGDSSRYRFSEKRDLPGGAWVINSPSGQPYGARVLREK